MNNLSGTKMFFYALATVIATAFNFAIVILEFPPAPFAYFFGALNGGAWVILLVLFCKWRNIS